MSFCEILRGLRQEKGLTQYEVAKNCGLTPTCICQLESGARNPTGSTVAALAAFFGVSADYLLGLTSDDSSQLYNVPTIPTYTPEERHFIEGLRKLTPGMREILRTTLDAMINEKSDDFVRTKIK